ncbi:MAG: hypothetical protein AAF430_07125 [Myxococcota bacterium]
MTPLERFLPYAADFEKTLVDDDWARLTPYFAEDSVYLVESDRFGAELTGPDAIFAGMKKSLDGFDRVFESRDVRPSDPEIEDDSLEVDWSIIYHKPGLPDFVLEGRSRVEYRDGVIARLVDSYDEAATNQALAAWTADTGIQLDPSYT